MKNISVFIILVAFHLIIEVSSVVNFKDYKSNQTNPIITNKYNDLLNISVQCPNKGALKNFVIRANSTHVWYEFNCYSSLTDANEYDESILKGLHSSSSYVIKSQLIESLDFLSKINVKCSVDYALNGFKFYINSDNYLAVDYTCVGVKNNYQTKDNTISTDINDGPSNTLGSLIGLTCGDNTIETDEIPGTPLRGFNFYITSLSNGNVKAKYLYSYFKLRSIELEKAEWASKTKALRDGNTQKN